MAGSYSLVDIAVGKRVKILAIGGGTHFTRKLENMGVREGDTITLLNKHILRGPVVVKVKNSKIALGYMMAKRISVETV